MDCDRQLLKFLIALHLSSSLHVNIIIAILLVLHTHGMEVSTDNWLMF